MTIGQNEIAAGSCDAGVGCEPAMPADPATDIPNTPDTTAGNGISPDAPTLLGADYAVGSSWNYLTWGAISGSDQYTVYWQVGSGVSSASHKLSPTKSTDYGHSGVVAGYAYCYRVQASNAYGVSGLSNERCVTVPVAIVPGPSGSAPATPSLNSASYDAASKWNYLTWSAVSGADQYTVYWQVGSGVSSASSKLSATKTLDYGHSGVIGGHQYCYRVQASNAYGSGGLSNESCVSVPY